MRTIRIGNKMNFLDKYHQSGNTYLIGTELYNIVYQMVGWIITYSDKGKLIERCFDTTREAQAFMFAQIDLYDGN